MRRFAVILAWLWGALAQAPQLYAVEGSVTYVGRMPLGSWQGTNPTARGQVRWAEPEASGRVCVDMSKFDSGIGLRDNDARGVLEVAKYPQSCLDVSALRREGERAVLEGVLEIHGVRKFMRIEGTLRLEGDAYRFAGGFRTRFTEWNLKPPTVLFLTVEDGLEVRLEARALPVR
ncbi:YceI-like domain protein [Calidithermus terrae]|uniref:YceI-like domain protein n=1 Tax=Calidithermus terrae TaxID=1408545 RepID=A0A399F2F5_9DEIN|nr:YceI family protein [Calidithermus terrae]RIH90927.1 YceI-like domain protein [Calidithermus terrae]